MININKKKKHLELEKPINNEIKFIEYDNLFTYIPLKCDPSLIEAGLANENSNFMLDVD